MITDKERAKRHQFKIEDFKYADLNKVEWFFHIDSVYFTDNLNPPRYCKETKLSHFFRRMKLKKYITFGKPIDIINEMNRSSEKYEFDGENLSLMKDETNRN